MTTLLFVEVDFGRHGKAFLELDRDSNCRAEVLREIRSGRVIKVLEVDEETGTCRSVLEELEEEAGLPREPASLESSYQRLLALQDHNRKLRVSS